MTESLRVIFEKPQNEWTDDDKSEVKNAVDTFSKDIAKVCEDHGMQYKAVITVTEDGVRPTLNVIPFIPEEKK